MEDKDAQVVRIARALEETARTVARQAGEMQAMFIVLHALLAGGGVSAGVRRRLQTTLEHCTASNLQAPVHDDFIDGYLARADILLTALDHEAPTA